MINEDGRSELGELMARLTEVAKAGDPAQCQEPMAGVTRQVQGLRSEGRFGDLSITIDEPVSFGGTGTAPNPAEVLLAALGASLEVTLRCHADHLRIPVEHVSVQLSAALDNRAFFATSSDVRAGFAVINAQVRILSPWSDDQLEPLYNLVSRCCPVLDIIRGATPVALTYVNARGQSVPQKSITSFEL